MYPPHIRTYVVPASETADGKKFEKALDDVSVMMLVHRLDEIPALTSMLHMIKPLRKGVLRITGAHLVESSIATTDILRARERVSEKKGREGGRKEGEGGRKQQQHLYFPTNLTPSSLPLIPRTSQARGSSSLTSDPSLQMLSMVGQMLGARSVETDVLMGNPRSFASELIRKGKDRQVGREGGREGEREGGMVNKVEKELSGMCANTHTTLPPAVSRC